MRDKKIEKKIKNTKFFILENFSNDHLEIKVYKGRKLNDEDIKAYNIILGIVFIIGYMFGLLVGLISLGF